MTIAEWNEHLEDLIGLWHELPEDGVPLHEFLGMTFDEYGLWVRDSAAIPERLMEKN